MLFGIMLFVLVILSEKNKWYMDGVLTGFWLLSFMEIVAEMTMLCQLLINWGWVINISKTKGFNTQELIDLMKFDFENIKEDKDERCKI